MSAYVNDRVGRYIRTWRATGTICLRELFPVAVFALLKPRFMFLELRRKILAKIMRHKINLRIFKFYEYGDILTSIYMNRMLWMY